MKKFAAALVARRERSLLPERRASRGARSAEWFLARIDATARTEEPIRERFERPTGDIPAGLKSAMMECQKPFHLWNVTRIADASVASFEPVAPYKVGAAAKQSTDTEGRPGRVTPASRLLRGAREEVDLVRADAFGARRRLRRLLSESAEEQGLGVPDEG
ncbi:MAG: hypothetical protein ACAI25_02450 [Planctomycetota bacterium]